MLRKIAWVLTLLCMAFIFYMSSRSMDQSRTDSARFMAVFGLVEQEEDAYELGDGDMFKLHNAVRKNAHLIIYAGLGMLYFASLYGYFGGVRNSGVIAVALTALYGATDEFHQLFTHRGAVLGDILIDTLGGLAGVAVIGLTFFIIERHQGLRTFFGRAYDFTPAWRYRYNVRKRARE